MGNTIVLNGLNAVMHKLVADGRLIAFIKPNEEEVSFAPVDKAHLIPAGSLVFETADALALVMSEQQKRDGAAPTP